jgi:hypothetical protein
MIRVAGGTGRSRGEAFLAFQQIEEPDVSLGGIGEDHLGFLLFFFFCHFTERFRSGRLSKTLLPEFFFAEGFFPKVLLAEILGGLHGVWRGEDPLYFGSFDLDRGRYYGGWFFGRGWRLGGRNLLLGFVFLRASTQDQDAQESENQREGRGEGFSGPV